MAATPEHSVVDEKLPDLREFVYLDEVSLRSLLSSQKGEVTDSKTEEATGTSEAALTGTVGVSSPLVARAEIESRYQTSNSSTTQTSRKATVQSWFRELHEINGLRLVEPVTPSKSAKDLEELKGVGDPSLLVATEELRRGMLVEYRVRLSADPVFHLGTMVSEFTGMAQDYPEMFAGGNGLDTLREVQPINRILQRLLAGLIPIRTTSVDYVVVEIDGIEHIVHRELIHGLDLLTKPLEVVGVTEHLAYWKDIRRVLFSDAEFTMLCRISRPGLHDNWTPVKLADLFKGVAPDLVEQINAAGKVPFDSIRPVRALDDNEARLGEALRAYVAAVQSDIDEQLSDEHMDVVNLLIVRLKLDAATVTGQRAAFGVLANALGEMLGNRPDAARALALRELARQNAGLSLFPTVAAAADTTSSAQATDNPVIDVKLLDVDVVAIYW